MGKIMIIGITGGSGVGKGEVCSIFKELGIPSIDADKVYRKLCSDCLPMLEEITSEFGDVLDEHNALDRKRLGEIVFCDKNALAVLNEITIPYILDSCKKAFSAYEAQGFEAVLYDAPTLFESGSDSICDKIINVVAPRDARITRICIRDNIAYDYAVLRMDAQHSDEWYSEKSDFTIDNSNDLDNLKTQVKDIYNRIFEKE